MGLNIREIVPRRQLEAGELRGKIIAVDAFNALYQFLTSIRQYDGTPLQDSKGRTTSHLSGLFYRNVALLSEGIKLIYVFASQDYDCLLFGAPKLIQNLTLSRKRKTISGYVEIFPEMIELEKVLNSLQIDYDQLISLGILVGTDYNPKGIHGIGQKKALQIVQKHKQPTLIFKQFEELDSEWKEVFEMFKKPDVDKNAEFKFPKLNEDKV